MPISFPGQLFILHRIALTGKNNYNFLIIGVMQNKILMFHILVKHLSCFYHSLNMFGNKLNVGSKEHSATNPPPAILIFSISSKYGMY